jgi:hypothetical protein
MGILVVGRNVVCGSFWWSYMRRKIKSQNKDSVGRHLARRKAGPGRKMRGRLLEHSRVCARDQGEVVEDIHGKRARSQAHMRDR